jgi:hypothetical protein
LERVLCIVGNSGTRKSVVHRKKMFFVLEIPRGGRQSRSACAFYNETIARFVPGKTVEYPYSLRRTQARIQPHNWGIIRETGSPATQVLDGQPKASELSV